MGLIAGLLLLLGFCLVLITFIDLDRFREPITAQLSKATGMTVELESLNLEFTHGLGFRCNGLHFLSKDGSKDLFYAEKIYLLAELKPLLQKQFKIKKATVVNPILKIDLAASSSQKLPSPRSTKEAIKNERKDQVLDPKTDQGSGSIPRQSQTPEPIFKPKNQMKDFEKILRETDFTIQNIEIRNGQILLTPKPDGSATAHTIPIIVSFLMNLQRPTPEQMDARIDSMQLGIAPLKFQGKGRLKTDSENPFYAVADLTSLPLSLAELKTIEKYLPGFQFPDQLKEGNLEKISLHFDLPLNDFKDLDSLQKNARMDFNVKISNAVYQAKERTFKLSRLEGEGSWKNQLLEQKFRGELFGGQFQEEGTLQLSTASEEKFSLAMESEITFKGIDFSLLPKGDKNNGLPSQGKGSGAFKFKGPVAFIKNVADFSGLHWNGSAEAKDTAWDNPDFPQISRATLQIKDGTPALTMAEVKAERLAIQNIPIKKTWGLFRITPENLRLVDGKIWPKNGEIRLTGNLNSVQETYSLNIKGDQLKAEDLSRQSVSGSVRFLGKFNGRLRPAIIKGQKMKKFSPFTRGLSGKLKLNITDGRFQQIEGIKALLVMLNPSTALEAGKHGLEYKFIGGNFKIRNGQVVTDDLKMDGPQLKMFVAGKADLPTRKVRADIKAMPLQMIDGLVKAVPLLGQFLTGGKKGVVLETYFKVTGTLDKPEIELLTQKSAIKKPADLLRGLFKAP
jgi:hypothetical protein